jgi:integrase
MRSDAIVTEDYAEERKDEYRNYFPSISSASAFEDDLWSCDKLRRSSSQRKQELEFDFKYVPVIYKEDIKYFIVINLMSRQAVSTIKKKLGDLRPLYEYAYELGLKRLFNCSNHSFAVRFKKYLDEHYPSEEVRRNKWTAANMFSQVFDQYAKERPFCSNPYSYREKAAIPGKYIPQYVLTQTDEVFLNETLPVHIRLTYWILRLIPSRISEVCGMEINCLNIFNGVYVIFIPTWKQNGGYRTAQIRRIYLKYEGIAVYLIDLIMRQQEISKGYQRYLHDYMKGLLLTYHQVGEQGKKKYPISMRTVKTVTKDFMNGAFKRICSEYGIKDEKGKPYHFSTHQFRHAGITDRLEQGFTPEQIRFMTAHQSEAMILNSYNHLHLKTDYLTKVQKSQLADRYTEKVLFRGRVLRMDETQEQRLLSNIRAQKVRGGICSDITGCSCDMLSCCECEHFIVDAKQKVYFEEQIRQWRMKLERFGAFPLIKDNAQKNIRTYETLVERIQRLTGGSNE